MAGEEASGDGEAPAGRAGSWRATPGGREFLALVAGQTVSDAGSEITAVAVPLLVLALTGSAFQTGLVAFAGALAHPLAALPAGIVADRWDRRRLLLGAAGVRAAAVTGLLIWLLAGRPPLVLILVVTVLDRALTTVALAAERGAVRRLLGTGTLPEAVALNEGRIAAATIVGPPAGGVLFGLARVLPFAVDAVSFAAVLAALARIRTPLQEQREDVSAQRFVSGALAGLRWLWGQPFLRAGSLLYATANVTLNALQLLAILLAKHAGASSAEVGVMFALVGAGGLSGALLATRVSRRVPAGVAVAIEPWAFMLLMPGLLVLHSAVAIGLLLGVMFAAMPLSSAAVIGRRIALTPDHLQGRVQAGSGLIASGLAWLGPLAVGAAFQPLGPDGTVLLVFGWALAIVVGVSASPSLRSPPQLPALPSSA